MSYTFTTSEQQQIQAALAQCTGLTWNAVDEAYDAVKFAGTNVLPFYTTLSNLLAQKLANPEGYDAATLADFNSAKL
jgi:hypothetical protein